MTDAVNNPPHYKANGIETIDVIEAFGLGFHLGNAVKYILRAGRKGSVVTDLEKARWYLDREIMHAKRREIADERIIGDVKMMLKRDEINAKRRRK